MRYLKERNEFIRERFYLITEASGPLENDVPWGDTLLGRLINSTIRKAGVGANLVKIDSVIQRLKDEFDKLIGSGVVKTMGEKTRVMVTRTIFSSILKRLKKAVEDGEKVKIIITITQNLISEVKEYEPTTPDGTNTKNELIGKLEEFLKALEGLPEEKEIKGIEGKPTMKGIEGKPTMKGIEGPKVDQENKNTELSTQVEPKDEKEMHKEWVNANKMYHEDKIRKNTPKNAKIKDLMKSLNDAKDKKDFKKFAEILNSIKELGSVDENIQGYKFFIKEAEDAVIHTSNKPEAKPDTPSEGLDKHQKSQKVREVFYRIFSKEYLRKWEITEESVKKLEKEVEKASNSVNELNLGVDPIVEIVKIFNMAHKIHTQPTIQSGRTEGKVSNKTFREYTWVGEGQPGTPANPSVGAWRNNSLFNKWESAVMDIIKDPKYQVIFNEKTAFKFGEADARVNLKKVSGTSKVQQGGGKTLLKFINEMLDGDKLYKAGAQKRFIEEYFGVQTTDKDLGIGSYNENKLKSKEIFTFVEKKFGNTPGTVYAIHGKNKEGKDRLYYLVLVESVGGSTYFMWSHTFEKINPIVKKVKKNCQIVKGDMPVDINLEKSFTEGDVTKTYINHYSRIPSDSFNGIKDLTFKSCTMGDKAKDEEVKSAKIYRLVNKLDGGSVIIPNTDIESISKDIDKIKGKLK